MSDSTTSKQNPADIARETFRQLSAARTQPTPDAYRKLYNEIAGINEKTSTDEQDGNQHATKELESVLVNLAKSVTMEGAGYTEIGKRLATSAENRRWNEYTQGLNKFIEKIFSQIKNASAPPVAHISDDKQVLLLKDLLTRTLGLALPALLNTAPELSHESESLATVLKTAATEKEMTDLGSKLKNLYFKIENLAAKSQIEPVKKAMPANLLDGDGLILLVSKLLSQTLGTAVSSLLQNNPPLLEISESLAKEAKNAKLVIDFQHIETRLKDLCYKITLKTDDHSEQLQLLLALFQLLLKNVSSLLDDGNWLRGQVIVIQNLITGEIDHRSLLAATKGLKEVIYKQGILKDSIAENKVSVKQLMTLFIDRLDVFASTTGAYHEKITVYTEKITPTSTQEDINEMLSSLMADTLHVQSEARHSHSLMISAQKEVMEAEAKIVELEQKLTAMSEQVQTDQLTGSMNRRGLDEILEREIARAERCKTPLCICMLDIDNFKKLNDTFGHASGDGALIHLVNIIKRTLRSIDVVARYGGEEFAIIMPETAIKDAADTMIRVQRELTREFFLAGDEHERIIITFSAGVAEHFPSEGQDSLIKRADKAMYEAKSAGKNRVVSATDVKPVDSSMTPQ